MVRKNLGSRRCRGFLENLQNSMHRVVALKLPSSARPVQKALCCALCGQQAVGSVGFILGSICVLYGVINYRKGPRIE